MESIRHCIFTALLFFVLFAAAKNVVSQASVFTNSIGMNFVLIPAGNFVMGSPSNEWKRDADETEHEVTLSKPFYLQATEVTQAQWKRVMASNPSYFKNCGEDCPVETVSWNDAQDFIKKLNQLERTTKYRLPTEAEWEYACRAGEITAFNTGTCITTELANYDGRYPPRYCPKGQYRLSTVKVAGFRPNSWGLYDMHGNVWEWCQDWYADYSTSQVTDPIGPASGEYRVLRGGSWGFGARAARSADRAGKSPSYLSTFIGFRVARDL
jgi:formylglycine-generating enzyme required for sulfatase activity